MKRWVIFDIKEGDWFDRPLKAGITKEQAVQTARREWERLSDFDKKHREDFFLSYCDVNDDGVADLDSETDHVDLIRSEYTKDHTHLKLSEKAKWYVNRLDDFHIYEYDTRFQYEYTYGWFESESNRMTEEQLNCKLEEFADELMEEIENE